MQPLLLATKIQVPPSRPSRLTRPRLIEALNDNVFDHALTLISAPAGYGKTTLMSQWAHARERRNIAWVSLESTENDPERFMRYLVAAWEQAHPGILESPVGLLVGATTPDLESVLEYFVNVATATNAEIVFALDDLHLIESAAVLNALTFLIDHLPPNAHIVASCRGEPNLPLARLRASGMLFELETGDLAFDLRETRWFLDRHATDLTDEQIAVVHQQLDGWVAGLQLLGHARRHGFSPVPAVATAGKQRFMTDYLKQEIIDRLSAERRDFLLQTSLLDQLSGELCDHVTEQTGSQQLLGSLEREGLFLLPLDETRTWFRYHPVFAGVLRELLQHDSPRLAAKVHRNAARWYLDNHMPDQAFGHAIASQDIDLVVEIAEDYSVIKLESGEMHTVAGWVEQVPESWYEQNHLLNLLKIAYLLYSGSFEESARLVELTAERIESSPRSDEQRSLGKIATVRCAIACFLNDLPLAENYASDALRDLSPEDRFYRTSVYHALGETYARNAFWEKAAELLKQALAIRHEPSYLIRSVHIYGALADLELRRGRLGAAEEYWRQSLEVIRSQEAWGRLPVLVTGWVFVRMAELHYERNDLEEARPLLERGLELARLGGEPRTLIAGNLLAVRMALACGDVATAEEHLEQARSTVEQTQFAEWTSRFNRVQIELWLAQDRLRAIARWVDDVQASAGEMHQAEPEAEQMTLARALLVLGGPERVASALSIVRELDDLAGAQGRLGIQIEASALQALALQASGDEPGGQIALEQALRLASPQGYVRLIADLGPSMWQLLHEARNRAVMPEYVGQILTAAIGALSRGSDGRPVALIEPLSDRERQVLELVAAGLTNAEMADRLFISPETVKKHTSSIYAKLAVRRRTEAVARARTLGLLDPGS